VLDQNPAVVKAIASQFTRLFDEKRLFRLLHGLAESIASQRYYDGFADLVDRHCSSLMDSFFGVYLEQLVSEFTLSALCPSALAGGHHAPAAEEGGGGSGGGAAGIDGADAIEGEGEGEGAWDAATLQALLALVELPSLNDIGSSGGGRQYRARFSLGFVPQTPFFQLLCSAATDHLVQVSKTESPAAQVHQLDALLLQDARLQPVMGLAGELRLWRTYARDLAAGAPFFIQFLLGLSLLFYSGTLPDRSSSPWGRASELPSPPKVAEIDNRE
jgi:hypothetical protein